MAIVKTTAPGGNLPEKKITPSATTAKTASRTGGVAVRQGVKPTDSKTFLNDTVAELRRVVWPTRDEVRAGVIVTIGLLVFFSLYIYGIDQAVGKLFTLLGLYPEQS